MLPFYLYVRSRAMYISSVYVVNFHEKLYIDNYKFYLRHLWLVLNSFIV